MPVKCYKQMSAIKEGVIILEDNKSRASGRIQAG